MPASMFILDRGHQPQPGMAVCNGLSHGAPCPVRKECREYADRVGCVGVWGGDYISSRDIYEDQAIASILDLGKMIVEIQDARPRPV